MTWRYTGHFCHRTLITSACQGQSSLVVWENISLQSLRHESLPICTLTFVYVKHCLYKIILIVFVFVTAIRFGRMPQSEKLKLRAELQIPEKEEREMQLDDWKTLASQIHEAYLKQFHLNKAKARGFLTGKNNTAVSNASINLHILFFFFIFHIYTVS